MTDWVGDDIEPEECDHQWVKIGTSPEWGPIYECSRCMDRTP